MTMRSNSLFPPRRAAALALAVGLLSFGASAAHAQWFRWPSWDEALSPMRVERMIQASGYRLTAPVLRNGPVYLANVLGRDDDLERLVIDARDGRLLQRYAVATAGRPAAVAGNWSDAPRPQAEPADVWLDRDDGAPPRPPVGVYAGVGVDAPRLPLPDPVPRPHPPQANQVARAEDSSDPYVILAPPAATHEAEPERAKPKPLVKRKKPEATPVAQPAAPPAVAKPTPVALPAVNPGAAAPTRTDAAGESAHAAPRVADSKPAPTPAPEIVPAAPAAAPPATAAAPKAAKSAPNDVPVAPLE